MHDGTDYYLKFLHKRSLRTPNADRPSQTKKMSVVVKTDIGWFIDHQLSLDDTYKLTKLLSSVNEDILNNDLKKFVMEVTGKNKDNDGRKSENTNFSAKFQCNPDLFAIWHPFLMDSQFRREFRRGTESDRSSQAAMDISDLLHTRSNQDSSTNESTELDTCHTLQVSMPDTGPETKHLAELNCGKKKKKRKRKLPLNTGELASQDQHQKICQLVSNALDQLKTLLLKNGYNPRIPVCDNNASAREAAAAGGLGDVLVQRCQEAASHSHQYDYQKQAIRSDHLSSSEDLCNKLIEQHHETAVMQMLMESCFLIPPKSRFLLSDISCLEQLLVDETQYDCVVIDPPWENKSVKRKKMYNTLADFELLDLPVKQLCGRDALVVVWVTNKQQQQNFVIEHLFPAWGVKYLTKWYWLKVTKSLVPVCDLNSDWSFKRPYECILLGYKSTLDKFTDIPHEHVVISVPCSIHSRKPPLNEVLQPYLPKDAKCLEMFARSLLPKWTSWGNEVLAFQHIDFFEVCTKDNLPETGHSSPTLPTGDNDTAQVQ